MFTRKLSPVFNTEKSEQRYFVSPDVVPLKSIKVDTDEGELELKTTFLKPGIIPNLLSLVSQGFTFGPDYEINPEMVITRFLIEVKTQNEKWVKAYSGGNILFTREKENSSQFFSVIGHIVVPDYRTLDLVNEKDEDNEFHRKYLFDCNFRFNRQTNELTIETKDTPIVRLLGIEIVVEINNVNRSE